MFSGGAGRQRDDFQLFVGGKNSVVQVIAGKTGTATITVRATDQFGAHVNTPFTITVTA